ncbi:MAG: CDGSH iron-sulfur domain-containing protein [Sporichthyaceae bacterium]
MGVGGRESTPTRVAIKATGPMLIDGPVEITTDHGEPMLVDRFLVAICTCRASRAFPLCDGSHRRLGAGSVQR